MEKRRAGTGSWGMGMLALIIVVLLGCAIDQATLQKRLESHYRLQRPEGNGPFPAVMMVPGCRGVASSPNYYMRTAEQLKAQGQVVVFVDYTEAHGVQSACSGEVSVQQIAQDILTTAAYLQSLPFVNASEIRVIGWSLGGGGVLASLSAMPDGQPLPFRAATAIYSVCQGVAPWKTKVPTLLLLGELDDITPAAVCQKLVQQVPQDAPVEVRIYPGARHGFTISELPPVIESRLGTQRYNPQAATAAWEEILRFLRR